MWKAQVLTEWQESEGGNEPALGSLLQAGDSAMDVTGQAAGNIPPDPNSAVWEVWSGDGSLLDVLAGDDRFFVLMEWEE